MPTAAAGFADRLAPGEGAVEQIVAFMRGHSIEATRPKPGDIAELARAVAPATHVFLTSLPHRPVEELVDAAARIRAAGLEPVPHLAARHHQSIASIGSWLDRLQMQANVRRVLLIGGDVAKPVGDVADSGRVVMSGVLEGRGLAAVALPGFPEGHPFMSEEEIESALVTRLARFQRAGLDIEIVSQFCFDPSAILRWLGWLDTRGLHVPVRIGLAGPTSLATWLNFARRCGVRASAEALARRSGLMQQAFRPVAPDPLVRLLAARTAHGRLGDVRPHFYSFGGTSKTAHWVDAPAHGRIRLTPDGGFEPLD